MSEIPLGLVMSRLSILGSPHDPGSLIQQRTRASSEELLPRLPPR